MSDSTGATMPQDLSALIARLRVASAGYDEWRVQDPRDGSYCMAYSWPENFNPEREAREWLADHKARFPGGLHSGFVVACVRVVNDADRLRLDAATALEAQAAEIARLRAAIHQIAALDPNTDSPEGRNEWGEADCFRQARKIARNAFKEST